MAIELKPVGVIHSPWVERGEAPRQGALSDEVFTIEVYPDYAPALAGIEAHEHLIVLYWADRSDRDVLLSRRFPGRGIFATRSPERPNPISVCVCRLLEVQGNRLRVRGLDALDGSPLLDLKPFYREVDCP